jgi:hypothetical protein
MQASQLPFHVSYICLAENYIFPLDFCIFLIRFIFGPQHSAMDVRAAADSITYPK